MSFFGNDPRDKYVGSWSFTSRGSTTLFGIPQTPYEIYNSNGSAIISKTGSNGLEISLSGKSLLFELRGNTLSTDSDFESCEENGLYLQLRHDFTGQAVSGTSIIIKKNTQGTWKNQWGEGGKATGELVVTLQR